MSSSFRGLPCRSHLLPVAFAASLCLAQPLFAQSLATPPAAAQPPISAASAEQPLPEIVVRGHAPDNSLLKAETVLSGDRLVGRRAATLGETLDGLPGLSAGSFGPNSSRPIVRGQDGERTPILQSGGASLDASSLSADHAVPIDTLGVERIELLRGPAALRYSGSAVGGVLNAVDNRVPRQQVGGTGGVIDLQAGGPARGGSAAALLETGNERFAAHADVFWRDAQDLHTPTFDRPDGSGGTERSDRVINSSAEAKGGAVGGSLLWDHGYLGASFDGYHSDYGTVAEEDVRIHMQRNTARLAGEVRLPGAFVQAVRGQLASTDYRHTEMEGEEVGTVFTNEGVDGRLELDHAPVAWLGGMRGQWGLQFDDTRFSALGEEAFVPSTKTRRQALFALETWQQGAWAWDVGLRVEHSRVESAGDTPDAAEPRFGDASSREFDTGSLALGAAYELSPGWKLQGNLAHTERAPSFYELYANGVHVATGAFELGNPDMDVERGVQGDLALVWKHGDSRARFAVFGSRFSNYIALERDPAADFDEGGEIFPGYAFRGVRADFSGVEAEAAHAMNLGGQKVVLQAHGDSTRATNRDTGEPLPRIAPWRLGLGAQTAWLGWSWSVDVDYAARQDRVSADDTPTPSYTMVNLGASYKLRLGQSAALVYAKLSNLTDELAYNAASLPTVRELSPQGGRAFSVGMRLTF